MDNKLFSLATSIDEICFALKLEGYVYGKLKENGKIVYFIDWCKANGKEVHKEFNSLKTLINYLDGVLMAIRVTG